MLALPPKDNRNMLNFSHQEETRASKETMPFSLIARKAMECLKTLADKELPRARECEQELPGNSSWEAAVVFGLEQQPRGHLNKPTEAAK